MKLKQSLFEWRIISNITVVYTVVHRWIKQQRGLVAKGLAIVILLLSAHSLD